MMAGVVRPETLSSLRPAGRSSGFATHGRYRIHQRDHLGNLVFVSASQRGREWNAVRFGHEVVRNPLAPAIYGVTPLFFSRVKHGYRTSRRQLVTSRSCQRAANGPARSRLLSSTLLAFGQASSRPAVMPEPQPSSGGGYSHGIPVRRTKRIAERALRLSIG
jgi:hypothetical protein